MFDWTTWASTALHGGLGFRKILVDAAEADRSGGVGEGAVQSTERRVAEAVSAFTRRSPEVRYDPERAPDPKAWLRLEEWEQIRLVEAYHRRARIRLPNAEAHAIFHTIVESQIAGGVAPVIDALARLRREGLSRHDGIHAIGAVLSGHMWDLLRRNEPVGPEGANQPYFDALAKLTAADWLASGEEAADDE